MQRSIGQVDRDDNFTYSFAYCANLNDGSFSLTSDPTTGTCSGVIIRPLITNVPPTKTIWESFVPKKNDPICSQSVYEKRCNVPKSLNPGSICLYNKYGGSDETGCFEPTGTSTESSEACAQNPEGDNTPSKSSGVLCKCMSFPEAT